MPCHLHKCHLGTNNNSKIIDEDMKQRRTKDKTFGDTRVCAKESGSVPFQNDLYFMI